MDDVHLEDHVVVHEVGESRLVSDDAANFGGSEEDVLGLLTSEERLYGVLATEVELRMGAGDDVGVALAGELTHDGGAYHATVACDVYFGVLFHFIQLCAVGGLCPCGRLCRYARVCAARVNYLARKISKKKWITQISLIFCEIFGKKVVNLVIEGR